MASKPADVKRTVTFKDSLKARHIDQFIKYARVTNLAKVAEILAEVIEETSVTDDVTSDAIYELDANDFMWLRQQLQDFINEYTSKN